MPTVVEKPLDLSVGRTHDQHGLCTDLTGDEVAGLLQIFGVAEPDPRTCEHPDHLEVEQVAVVDLPRLQHGRGRIRHEAVGLPRGLIDQHIRRH